MGTSEHNITNEIIFNMSQFIFSLLCFGCFVHISLGEIPISFSNVSHYACDTKCISKYSESLTDCQSDTSLTPECLGKQLGKELPQAACNFSRAISSTAEQINEIMHNGRFTPYKWNVIRESFTKGPLSFEYIFEEERGTVSNIQVVADTESSRFQCQYNFELEQDTSRSAEVRYYTVNDGVDTQWHWGWLFHSENVHIFLSCQAEQGQEKTKPYGAVIVYTRVEHETEGDDALRTLDCLKDVKFDDSIVQCI